MFTARDREAVRSSGWRPWSTVPPGSTHTSTKPTRPLHTPTLQASRAPGSPSGQHKKAKVLVVYVVASILVSASLSASTNCVTKICMSSHHQGDPLTSPAHHHTPRRLRDVAHFPQPPSVSPLTQNLDITLTPGSKTDGRTSSLLGFPLVAVLVGASRSLERLPVTVVTVITCPGKHCREVEEGNSGHQCWNTGLTRHLSTTPSISHCAHRHAHLRESNPVTLTRLVPTVTSSMPVVTQMMPSGTKTL